MRKTWSLTIALALALRAATGQAQTEAELVARRELLTQAQAALQGNDFTRALDLAERAGRIQMTPSVRGFIADTQWRVGRIVEALASAERCAREVAADERLANRERVVTLCTTAATEARRRAGRIVLVPPAPLPEGLVVQVNQQVVNPALLGVAYLVNPGPVVLEATAPGRTAFRRELTVAQGAEQRVDVVLPAQSLAAPNVVVRPLRPVVVARVLAPRPSGPPVGPIVLGVLGGGAILGGAVTAAFYGIAHGQLGVLCDAAPVNGVYQCDPAAREPRDRAVLMGNLSIGLFAGGAALALGAVLWGALGRPRERPTVSAAVVPTRDGAVLSVGGVL